MNGDWYAVHTGPRAEWLARDRLQQRGYRTFLPHFLAEASHARRVVQVRRPAWRAWFIPGRAPCGFLASKWRASCSVPTAKV
jgi:hypothetical protein